MTKESEQFGFYSIYFVMYLGKKTNKPKPTNERGKERKNNRKKIRFYKSS